jgi:AcrR family transcriptional regulator
MEQDKTKRKLQKRSIETKGKILDTAYQLFCSNGYFNTSTNEIAKAANVSIGGLYSHYPDKDTIFMEILDRYNLSFIRVLDELSKDMQLYLSDPKAWFRRLIDDLLEVHRDSKELNREIEILSYTKPEIAKVRKTQHEKTRQIMYRFLCNENTKVKVTDLKASNVILMGLLDAIIEQIMFGDHAVSDDRIIQAGVDAMYNFLVG